MATTDTVKTTLAEARKPLFASVGVTELAVSKARELPGATAAELARLQAQAKELQSQVRELPAQVKVLRGTVTAQTASLRVKARGLYDDLVGRGEKVLGTLRAQPAAKQAVRAGTTAVKQARSATSRTSAQARQAESKAQAKVASTVEAAQAKVDSTMEAAAAKAEPKS